jgi:uncharacterized protein YjiK
LTLTATVGALLPCGIMPRKKATPGGVAALPLRLLDDTSLGLEGASAVAPLGGSLALVVDDDEGIYLIGAGEPRLLRGRKDAKGLGDLESVCVSDDGGAAYAVSEKKGQVFSFEVIRGRAGVSLSEATLLGVVERPGDVKNKGWEGASFLRVDGAPHLVLTHERDPMAVGLFALPDLRPVALVTLDGPFEALLEDVADVAVCPSTGHLFLLSDQSERVVEARLLPDGALEPVAAFDLALDGEKPEGIAFESPDRLVIVTDASGRLLRYALDR